MLNLETGQLVAGAGAVAVGEGLSDKECLFAYKMSRTRPEVKLQRGKKQNSNPVNWSSAAGQADWLLVTWLLWEAETRREAQCHRHPRS